MVRKLRSISDKIVNDYKSVTLIMLLGNNVQEHTTAFDFIISAKWLNDYDQESGLDIVLDYLYDNLNEREMEHISRVTIIHTDDFIVQSLTSSMSVQSSVIITSDCIFGNVEIPYAIIFESRFE